MKYKVGDKIKIRTIDKMKEEYDTYINHEVICPNNFYFTFKMDEQINNNFPDRILTIKKVGKDDYLMAEFSESFTDDMIERLVEKEVLDPILSRFDILDL